MTAEPSSTAAPSPTLFEVRGDLVLAALCIGRFHAPCQINADHLVVEASEELAEALREVGLQLAPSFAPISPTTVPGPASPRRVVTHGTHSIDDDEEAETPHGPASNA